MIVNERDGDVNRILTFSTDSVEQLLSYEYQIEDPGHPGYMEAANLDTVLVSGATLNAINATDGTVRWTSEESLVDVSLSSNILIHRSQNKIKRFNINDGGLDQAWKFKGETERVGTLAFGNGHVAATTSPRESFSDDGYNLYVLDPESGSVQWCQYMGRATTPPAIAGDALYAGIGTSIQAFDLSTGDPLWRYLLSDPESLRIAPVNGAVIYSTGSEVGALTAA